MAGWPGLVFNRGYQIYGPPSTRAMSEAASDFNALNFEEFDAFALKWPAWAETSTAKDLRFPSVIEIKPTGGVVLETDNIKVTATLTPHMMSENGYSFSYRVDSSYGSVVISGDTVPSLDVVELAKGADLLVHEAARSHPFPKSVRQFKLGDNTEALKTDDDRTLHTSPIEVGKVAQRAGVKKLVTTHHQGALQIGTGVGACWNNANSQKEWELNNRVIAAIRQNYDGDIVIGAPCMSFTIDKNVRSYN